MSIGLLAMLGAGCGGSAESDSAATGAGNGATARYRTYLDENAATLVGWLARLSREVAAGHLSTSQSRFDSAHVPYGHLEPLADSLQPLDFGQVEKRLWVDRTVDGVEPLARALQARAKGLRRRLRMVELRPETIAADLNTSLDGVLSSEVTGKHDPYSHIDLVDVAATVEGVEAGFEALRPGLVASDPALAREIEGAFARAYVAIGDFGFAAREQDQPRPSSPGTSFVLYVERSAAEFDRLGRHIGSLAALIAEIPAETSG